MSARRGLSILEVVVAMALLALGFLFVLGIVPTGVTSIKRSEDIEAATAYGMELMEDARHSLPPATAHEYVLTMNQTEFHFRRELVRVNDDLTDIVVTATWSETLPGIRLVTRVQGQPAEEVSD
jgi:prepilin-type N-terminal cleavage/methylation domain-containing protein